MRSKAALAAVVALFVLAQPSGRAEAASPLFEFFASSTMEGSAHAPYPPPGSGFEAACGIAVDAQANFYVADYYHHNIDVFTPSRSFITQIPNVDPGGGPCGLAVAPGGTLYVNNYHRNVVRYVPAHFPLGPGETYGPGVVIDSENPTGVAVDPLSGRVYVDDRTHVSVYDPSGSPLLDGEGKPVQIGAGSIEEGYGLALGQAPGPYPGRLYLADAADGVIEAYDPAVDTEHPIQVIDGDDAPGGGFVSLRDASLAVDRSSGTVYVTDLLQPSGYERPEAAVYGFDATGAYAGSLPYNIVDPRPAGLAVDASSTASLGRVYVSSGNTEAARIYAYPPGSLSAQAAACAPQGPCPFVPLASPFSTATRSTTPPGPATSAALPAQGSAAEGTDAKARRSAAAIAQKGTLRVRTEGEIAPRRLPRKGVVPIAVSIAGEISTTDESMPPQLQRLQIEINRHGHLDYRGLPTCPYRQIQTASSRRALASCRSALVGRGSFAADILLSGQEPYPTEGELLVFNGERSGKPVLYGHLYAPRPFASSFVIVFAISQVRHGTYGTVLRADLPKALGNWGNLTALRMRLARRYRYEGRPHSYLSSGCPAPLGIPRVSFPLLRTAFYFANQGRLTSTLVRTCTARG